jgi:hypothetical protein
MLPRLAAVVQEVFVVAPGVLESVGEDGHAVEGTLGVDAIGEGEDGWREPGGVEVDGAERVSEKVSKANRPKVGGTFVPRYVVQTNHSFSCGTPSGRIDYSVANPFQRAAAPVMNTIKSIMMI